MREEEIKEIIASGHMWIGKRNWVAALDAFEAAIQLDPKCAPAWEQKGKILKRLGRVEEALEAFERIIGFIPDDPDAWYNRGVCLTKLGRNEEALESFCEARRLSPEHSVPQSSTEAGFLDLLSRGGLMFERDHAHEGSGGVDRISLPTYVNEAFGYRFHLSFVWEDDTEDVLDFHENSRSSVQICSSRFSAYCANIMADARIPCDYPAKELAADLAEQLTADGGEKRFYVFTKGMLPAYLIHRSSATGQPLLCDLIVTDHFVYRLERPVGTDEKGHWFAENIISGFEPIMQV